MIEVTSSTNLDTCKTVCDELLVKMLEMGLGKTQQVKKLRKINTTFYFFVIFIFDVLIFFKMIISS